MQPVAVTLPLLNPNEPEALLAAVHVREGQRVAKGDLLCTLETTKSTAELQAEEAGYVAGLQLQPGKTYPAGEVFCYLSDDPDWAPAVAQPQAAAGDESVPEGLRITQPALLLAKAQALDLSRLPVGPVITESMVRALVEAPGERFALPQAAFDPTAILVYGGGGHGKALIDLLRALRTYQIAGIVDDGLQPGTMVMGLPVLGGRQALSEVYTQGVRLAVNAVGGIGNIAIRIQVFQTLAEAGFTCPAVVHPNAVVEPSARLAPGVQVFAQAYVGSEAQVGYGTIINTGAIVSHDCRLGNYTNLSPGAILAGEVHVGDGALIGMGVTVNLGVIIGAGARVGNSATVKGHVPEGGVVRAGGIHG